MNVVKSSLDTICTVLTNLIEMHGITESQLARSINLPRATVNRIKLGKILDPKASTLIRIASYFNISVDQLLGISPLENEANKKQNSIVRVPLIEWNKALDFNNMGKKINYINSDKWSLFECCDNGVEPRFALTVFGEAMWPFFGDGSIIAVDCNKSPQNRSFVVAYIANRDEVVLRQLLIDGKTKLLTPMNNAFATLSLSMGDYIIGVVAQTKKFF